jgi:hypothetical protein
VCWLRAIYNGLHSAEKRQVLDVTDAMTVLSKTFQKQGNYPTQCSWVFDPTLQTIYMAIAQNTSEIFKISLKEEIIENTSDNHTPSHLFSEDGIVINKLCQTAGY